MNIVTKDTYNFLKIEFNVKRVFIINLKWQIAYSPDDLLFGHIHNRYLIKLLEPCSEASIIEELLKVMRTI